MRLRQTLRQSKDEKGVRAECWRTYRRRDEHFWQHSTRYPDVNTTFTKAHTTVCKCRIRWLFTSQLRNGKKTSTSYPAQLVGATISLLAVNRKYLQFCTLNVKFKFSNFLRLFNICKICYIQYPCYIMSYIKVFSFISIRHSSCIITVC